jgi:23S rRNA (cytosine1962-C5)-methyltransferase
MLAYAGTLEGCAVKMFVIFRSHSRKQSGPHKRSAWKNKRNAATPAALFRTRRLQACANRPAGHRLLHRRCPHAKSGHAARSCSRLKSFRDKRRDNRPHQSAKGAGDQPRPQAGRAPARPEPQPRERLEAKADDRSEPKSVPRILARRDGALPTEHLPVILEVAPNADYALLDSGAGQKLEQYGPYRIVRPEGQAIWQKALPAKDWERADAIFTGDTDEEGIGRWRFPKTPLGETWPMKHDGIDYLGRFTSFRHVGVFPEQASHWDHMAGLITAAKRPVKVLNLFGYTGLASLVAARAGAEVTHVDASKKAIGWARENQEMAGLGSKPIRWIVDDAVKFAEREERRGSR